MTLEQFFRQNPKIALGFSGGVDSSFLLYAAKKYGADVRPYFIQTQFQPDFEREDAERAAEYIGVEISIIEADALASPRVAENGPKRCYYCKTALFGILTEASRRDGYPVLMDGTNASDDASDRPGMRALKELKVVSPLQECGITKAEVRRLSREAGLFTWNKPAYACLATRIPVGCEIREADLTKVAKAEKVLFAHGFSDFRVRLSGDLARIQLRESQMGKLMAKREEILGGLEGFSAVALDLNPRQEEKE